MKLDGLTAFPISGIRVTDQYIARSYKKEMAYLTSLKIERLLAGFRETAGLQNNGVQRYPGWESTTIGGHTLGHYMCALASGYMSGNSDADIRAELLDRMKTIITELKSCQDNRGSGYIFGARIVDPSNVESQFDVIETQDYVDIIKQAWVPWYTMHKLLTGLVAFATLKTSYKDELEAVTVIADTAAGVMSRLADWVYKRTSGWNEGVHRRVLNVEYGGMNDVMYCVYQLTGKKEHLEAAHAFDDIELFERITEAEEGSNVLINTHANTTIPKFIGAMRRYIVTGELRYLEYAKSFWNLVKDHHSYITGNNSRDEHFRGEDELNKDRTYNNCETCNAYNMLKYTRLLFENTGDAVYTDFAENLYINTILSSQDPETGMTTYFQPMGTGYFKVFSSPYDDFWCCTGTGMENFSKPGEYAFYSKEGCFAICNYISADISNVRIGLKIEANVPESDRVKVLFTRPYDGTLALRLPDWVDGDATVTIDGEEYGYAVASRSRDRKECRGFALVGGPFDAGSVVEITLPMSVHIQGLKDDPSVFGFKYGPTVLSARLGDSDKETSRQGVNVLIPAKSVIERRYIPTKDEIIHITAGSFDEFTHHPERYLVREIASEGLSFELKGTNAHLRFGKHYENYNERYGIYFSFTDEPYTEVPDEPETVSMEAGSVQAGSAESPYAGISYADASADEPYYGPAGKPSEPFTFYIEPKKEADEPAEQNPVSDKDSTEAQDSRKRPTAPAANKPVSGQFITTVSGLSKDAAGTAIESITCSIGAVYYSAGRNAYLIRVPEKDPKTGEDIREVSLSITLNCDGYVEVDRSDARKDSIRLDVMKHRFTGHRLRLYDPDCRLEKDYAVIIETVPDTAPETPAAEQGLKRGDASAPVRGSFQGEVCYIMDATGDPHADLGTYNSQHKQPFGADPETGYVWGVSGDSQNRKYRFEVEDGSYEVQIGFDVPEWMNDKPSLYQNYQHDRERLLASDIETTDELISYRVHVVGGLLALSLVSDDGGVSAWRIEVHSLQTTAVPYDGEYIVGVDPSGHIYGAEPAEEPITAYAATSEGELTETQIDRSQIAAAVAGTEAAPAKAESAGTEAEADAAEKAVHNAHTGNPEYKPVNAASDITGPLAESAVRNEPSQELPLSGVPDFIEVKNARAEADERSREERLAEEVRKYLEEQEIKQEAKRIAEEKLRQADSLRYAEESRQHYDAQRFLEEQRYREETKRQAAMKQEYGESIKRFGMQLQKLDDEEQAAKSRDLEATRRYVEEQYRKADVEHYVEQQRMQADSLWRLEQQKQQLEVKQLAEAQQLAARIRQQNEATRLAEARRVAEELRIQAETQKLMEQQRHEAEAQRVAEAQRIADELRKHAEAQLEAEQRRQKAETERLEALGRLAEEQKRHDEEQRRSEEQSWLEAANRYADEQSRQRNAGSGFSGLYSRYGYPGDERSIYSTEGRGASGDEPDDEAFELPTVEKIMSRKSSSSDAAPVKNGDDFKAAVKTQLKSQIMHEILNEMGVSEGTVKIPEKDVRQTDDAAPKAQRGIDVAEHEYKHESSSEIWFREEPEPEEPDLDDQMINIPEDEDKQASGYVIAPDELVIPPDLANALSAYEVIGEIGQPEFFDEADMTESVEVGLRAEAFVVDDLTDFVTSAQPVDEEASEEAAELPDGVQMPEGTEASEEIIRSIEDELREETQRNEAGTDNAAPSAIEDRAASEPVAPDSTPHKPTVKVVDTRGSRTSQKAAPAKTQGSKAGKGTGTKPTVKIDAGELGKYITGAIGVAGSLYAILRKKK